MRERLLANIRKLPQIVETWNGPEDDDPKPRLFAKHVTKVCCFLQPPFLCVIFLLFTSGKNDYAIQAIMSIWCLFNYLY